MTTPIAVGAALTSVKVESTAASPQVNVPITFGQGFARGAFPSTSAAVELRAPDGSVVPCQLDVKATFSGGSVKHAILSAIIPNLPASASVVYSIVRRSAPLAGDAAQA